jgi:positive regulator of sigma E activity
LRASLVSTSAIVICHEQDSLRIEVMQSAGCGACERKATCGSIAGSKAKAVQLDLPVKNLLSDAARPGERIIVAVDGSSFAEMVVLCYLVPAILMLLGAGFGALISDANPDLAGLAGAVVGLMVGCGLLRLYDSRVSYPVASEQPRSAAGDISILLTEP